MMERERFMHKHGAVWTHWSDSREHIVRFREIPELGLSQDYTYSHPRAAAAARVGLADSYQSDDHLRWH